MSPFQNCYKATYKSYFFDISSGLNNPLNDSFYNIIPFKKCYKSLKKKLNKTREWKLETDEQQRWADTSILSH